LRLVLCLAVVGLVSAACSGKDSATVDLTPTPSISVSLSGSDPVCDDLTALQDEVNAILSGDTGDISSTLGEIGDRLGDDADRLRAEGQNQFAEPMDELAAAVDDLKDANVDEIPDAAQRIADILATFPQPSPPCTI